MLFERQTTDRGTLEERGFFNKALSPALSGGLPAKALNI